VDAHVVDDALAVQRHSAEARTLVAAARATASVVDDDEVMRAWAVPRAS